MSDPIEMMNELHAVKALIRDMDQMNLVGNVYNVAAPIMYSVGQPYAPTEICLELDHDTTRKLLEARRQKLTALLRAKRADILRLADKLGDLETT